MSKQTEVMKLALEALESVQWMEQDAQFARKVHKIITALREALAEQPAQQVPVAWMYKIDCDRDDRNDFMAYCKRTPGYCIPLYTTPQAPKENT